MSFRDGRTLVLCFDGTADKYCEKNSNVAKFFSLLDKDDYTRQLCYYQAGIGTYFSPGTVRPVFDYIAKVADICIAWYLPDHVMDGYKFLMQNYRACDKICLFGFSRGAYTARALAGMLCRVGLLSRDNFEQVGFAYSFYERSDQNSNQLCAEFKRDYCRDVKVEFVGVWDTVASVGIVLGRNLPFTDSNTAVKTFRHAMSLDECRSRFRPNQFHRTPSSRDHVQSFPGPSVTAQEGGGAETDVSEVWFAGTHCDVGGGVLPNDTKNALSYIPLRWMVHEVMKSSCGILFDQEALVRQGIPVEPTEEVRRKEEMRLNTLDAKEPMHDFLRTPPRSFLWWLLEIVPMHFMWQDANDQWHTEYNIHFGRGRNIRDPSPKFHVAVKQRMDDPDLNYSPKARWTPGSETYIE